MSNGFRLQVTFHAVTLLSILALFSPARFLLLILCVRQCPRLGKVDSGDILIPRVEALPFLAQLFLPSLPPPAAAHSLAHIIALPNR